MIFDEVELTGAQLLQKERCQKFSSQAASRIRTAENCLFSLLPGDELERMSAGWYDACAQAMLYGNFAAIDKWIRAQAERAAAENFALEDVRELLAICKACAMEMEKWDTDVFSDVENVIQEALAATRNWAASSETAYSSQAADQSELQAIADGKVMRPGERRSFGRNRLQLPIRVRRTGGVGSGEINQTQSISRSGLYFVTQEKYELDQILQVSYPYWTHQGAINQEYKARVVRLDRLPDNSLGVALHFSENLASK